MIRILRLSVPLLLLFQVARAQYGSYHQPENYGDTTATGKKGFDRHRLFVGGSVGLSFGDYTYVNLSPMAGYRFTDWLAAGVNINSQYNSVKYYNPDNSLSQKQQYGLVGLGIFGRVYVIPQIFIHVQPEYNFIFGRDLYYNPSYSLKYKEQVPSLLMGGGYSQSVSDNSAFTIAILYDVLQEKNSPYGNQPIFRAGIDLGF